jgi:hypothetical protein
MLAITPNQLTSLDQLTYSARVSNCLNCVGEKIKAIAEAVCVVAKKIFELFGRLVQWTGVPFVMGFIHGVAVSCSVSGDPVEDQAFSGAVDSLLVANELLPQIS